MLRHLRIGRAAVFAGLCSLGVLPACDTFDSARGARSLVQLTQGPTPTQATEWALDRFDANNRYRGTMYLANQPWGGGPEYMQLYVDATQDADAGVRASGVRGIALHGDPTHVPLLIRALSDEDSIVRLDAARGLQRIHDAQAIEPLLVHIQIENEENELVRAESAHALGQYADRRVVDALIDIFDDYSLTVNEATRSSLRTLTGQDFGYDIRAWVSWTSETTDLFAARTAYVYPAFWREKRLIEWVPFIPQAPNEMSAMPVGFSPAIP